MATDTVKKLRSEALSLSTADHAELAHVLVKNLDEPADAADAWKKEILQRFA